MAPRQTCSCGECRKCRERVRIQAWREANRERAREQTARALERFRRRHPERLRAQRAKYDREKRDRVKKAARAAVSRAIRAGRLVREPCEHKGPECRGRVQAHHDDYEKPLDVRWLCELHHRAEHPGGAR